MAAIVKLQARESRGSVQYSVTVPKRLVEELGWKKGDPLMVRIVELELDGKKRKVLVMYRVE